MRKPYKGQPKRDRGPRINDRIESSRVRFVNEKGEMMGVVDLSEALKAAEATGLDLVEVSPDADPPVCKLLDYGKYKFEQQKKAAEARKKQKTIDIKEIKIRPTTEEHDYKVKLKAARKFLESGDKVKVSMRFRGREMAHQHVGMDMMNRLKADLEDLITIELAPKMDGRQMIMILASEIKK